MKPILLRSIYGLLLFSAVPAFAAGPNLCRAQEDPLFACQLQSKKFVAACALYDPALKEGYRSLVYRFGTSEHIELSLPEDPNQFRRSTYIDEATTSEPIEDDEYLRFVNGRFSYVLYTGLGKGFDLKGLAVFRDNQLVSKASCEPNTLEHNMSRNDLLALGVQSEIDSQHALRFWSQLLPRNSSVLTQKPPGDLRYRTTPAHAR